MAEKAAGWRFIRGGSLPTPKMEVLVTAAGGIELRLKDSPPFGLSPQEAEALAQGLVNAARFARGVLRSLS